MTADAPILFSNQFHVEHQPPKLVPTISEPRRPAQIHTVGRVGRMAGTPS
jgi:hypothetical protein